jgi:hypothetical protein
MYFNFKIKVPVIIESIIVYFLLRYRKKHFGYPFRKIMLTRGKYAIVDVEDFQKLSQYDWHLFETKGKYYAVKLNEGIIQFMHRVVMNAPKGKIVDHWNREGLDNRKSNLRIATHSQNNCNRGRSKNCRSKYRGVYLHKKSGKWAAAIKFENKRIFLGLFDNEEDAARAYDKAAKIYHGEFAVLNFNEDSHEDTKARNKEVMM